MGWTVYSLQLDAKKNPYGQTQVGPPQNLHTDTSDPYGAQI